MGKSDNYKKCVLVIISMCVQEWELPVESKSVQCLECARVIIGDIVLE